MESGKSEVAWRMEQIRLEYESAHTQRFTNVTLATQVYTLSVLRGLLQGYGRVCSAWLSSLRGRGLSKSSVSFYRPYSIPVRAFSSISNRFPILFPYH